MTDGHAASSRFQYADARALCYDATTAETTTTICGPDLTNQRAALVRPQIRNAPHFVST